MKNYKKYKYIRFARIIRHLKLLSLSVIVSLFVVVYLHNQSNVHMLRKECRLNGPKLMYREDCLLPLMFGDWWDNIKIRRTRCIGQAQIVI